MLSNIDVRSRKILMTLALAKSPAPLGYISLHTKIKEPLEILEKMEENGLVRRSPSLSWSCCTDPLFEITTTTRKKLLAYLFTPLESAEVRHLSHRLSFEAMQSV